MATAARIESAEELFGNADFDFAAAAAPPRRLGGGRRDEEEEAVGGGGAAAEAPRAKKARVVRF